MEMMTVDLVPPIVGGVMIGLGSVGLLATHGLIAGVSGLLKTALTPGNSERVSRAGFLIGVVVAGILATFASPETTQLTSTVPLSWLLPAGLLIGLGSHYANGCTSGHGVCGLGRFSPRSMVAVGLFSAVGAISLLASRALLGGVL